MSELAEWSFSLAQIQFGPQSLFNDLKNDRVLKVTSPPTESPCSYLTNDHPAAICRSPVNITGCAVRFKRWWVKERFFWIGLHAFPESLLAKMAWIILIFLRRCQNRGNQGNLGRKALPSAWWSSLRPSGEPQFNFCPTVLSVPAEQSTKQLQVFVHWPPSSFRGAASGRPPSMEAGPQWAGGVCWGSLGRSQMTLCWVILW